MSDTNLTGIWQGLYSYPAQAAHVPLTATLLDHGGGVDGTTHEVDPFTTPGVTLDATVTGRRADRAISFTKTYAARSDRFVPVRYEGLLNGEGTEVEGRWTIPGSLSGTFLMIRPERAAESAAVKRAERV